MTPEEETKVKLKSENEEYMYWLMFELGYSRRRARRKADRKFKKMDGGKNE